MFFIGQTRAVKAGQKSLVQYWHEEPNEQTKEGPLSFARTGSPFASVSTIPHWPLPAVRDLNRDGRVSTYDELYSSCPRQVSYRGKCARKGHPLKLPSPTKLARLGHFPPASHAGRLASPVFYTISSLWFEHSAGATPLFSLCLFHSLCYYIAPAAIPCLLPLTLSTSVTHRSNQLLDLRPSTALHAFGGC